VEEYLRYQDTRIRMLTADRDAVIEQSARLARRFDRQCAEARALRDRVRRLAGPPQRAEGMTERLHSMLRLAHEEITELRSRAQAEAATTTAATRIERMRAEKLRRRLEHELDRLAGEREQLTAERERVRAELAAERERLDHLLEAAGARSERVIRDAVELAEVLVRDARGEAHQVRSVAADEVIRLHEDGRRRREALDAGAADARALADEDFRIALAARRAEATADLERVRAAAEAESARLVAEARARAELVVERAGLTAAALVRAGEERHAEANRLLTEVRRLAH
jgi:cell division septum initiation protein DivIVA